MKQWSTLRRALLFCMPALATGLVMDQWGLRSLAWLFTIVASGATIIFAGYRVLEWLAYPKGTTRTQPGLIYLAVVACYALSGSLLGACWVEYRFTSLCEQLQSQIRALAPESKPDALIVEPSYRLIFMHAEVSAYLDDSGQVNCAIDDPRDFFYSVYYVSADEIRYHKD